MNIFVKDEEKITTKQKCQFTLPVCWDFKGIGGYMQHFAVLYNITMLEYFSKLLFFLDCKSKRSNKAASKLNVTIGSMCWVNKKKKKKDKKGNQLIATLVNHRVVRVHCVTDVGVAPSCERRTTSMRRR